MNLLCRELDFQRPAENGKLAMEENITMKTYEGMFLLDGGQPNFELACEPIRNVLDRSGAEVLSSRLWEDRKLAYEIKGRKRGLYVLTYFKMDVSKIVELENDCQLNEGILRVLFRRKDNLTDEVMNAPTPAMIETTTREHEAKPISEGEQATDKAAAKAPTEAVVEETTPQPATAEKPVTAEEPAVAEKPVTTEEPAVVEEPAAEAAEKESAE